APSGDVPVPAPVWRPRGRATKLSCWSVHPGGATMQEDSPTPPSMDMDPAEFRRPGHAVIERIATYLEEPERWPVLPAVEPGDVRARLPVAAPDAGESMDEILADFDRIIMPATTHWNHPGFFGYFSITGSAPGILGE